MKITAILAVRNEEQYLSNCLRHLINNGLEFAIIDNGSTDASREIYRRQEFQAHLVDLREVPFNDVFALSSQLEHKASIIETLETDWVVHLDADEIMHSYRTDETLQDGIQRIDAEGFNVINFDEHVFLPLEENYRPETEGHQPLRHYYFFQPASPRLMRAWRKDGNFSMQKYAGHRLSGSDIHMAKETFALRHYIVRSQEHAYTKYAMRSFSKDELAKGWHSNRVNFHRDCFKLPPPAKLHRLADAADRNLQTDYPHHLHFWQW